MSGVKGRSGRKGHYHELDVATLLEKSYSIQMAYFNDPDIPIKDKTEFACRYLQKRVGDKIEMQVNHVVGMEQLESLANKLIEKRSNDPGVINIKAE